MPPRLNTEIDNLAAPAEDGGLLFWPAARSWAAMAEANRQTRRACSIELAGRSVTELIAEQLAGPPIVMTGHQPGFNHPGVWVKSVAASRLAASLGGSAQFLLVDSDAPRQLVLSWPQLSEGADLGQPEAQARECAETHRAPSLALRVGRAVPFPQTDTGGLAYEQLPTLAAGQWARFLGSVPWDAVDRAGATWPAFVHGFLGAIGAAGYVDRWVGGVTAVESLLGVPSPEVVRVSVCFGNAANVGLGESGASCFVAHLLLNAEPFAAIYNAALVEYRQRRGIRGRQHPMPDLAVEGSRVESPFWILRGSQPRQRLFVSRRGDDGLELWGGDASLCVLSASALAREPGKVLAAGLEGHRVRPRALALTMYARLLACDLFIHGIGGAKYDQITDDVVRRFFGVELPAWVCASATCRLPLPRFDVTEADRAAAIHALRDLRYNPQRHVGGRKSANGPEAIAALNKRAEAVTTGLRLREESPGQHSERRAAFTKIREANETLLAAIPGAVEAGRRRLAEIDAGMEHNRVAKSREWFFALYPTEQLRRLADSVAGGGGLPR